MRRCHIGSAFIASTLLLRHTDRLAVEDLQRSLLLTGLQQALHPHQRIRRHREVPGRRQRRLVKQHRRDVVADQAGLHGREGAVRVPQHQSGLADRGDHGGDVLRFAGERVRTIAVAAQSTAAPVDQMQRVVLRERVHHRRPAVMVSRGAVHRHQRRTGAQPLEADLRTVRGRDRAELACRHLP
nr:hypothetical protein [Fodinicola feengrottensis]